MRGFCYTVLVVLAAVVGYSVTTRALEETRDFR